MPPTLILTLGGWLFRPRLHTNLFNAGLSACELFLDIAISDTII